MLHYLKTKNGTSTTMLSDAGVPTGMRYTAIKIGDRTDTVRDIISNLQADPTKNYLYQMDMKTSFITNCISVVERNTGSDINATWITDGSGRWYNEAFDGIYMVCQTSTFKVGLHVPTKRISVLDPNLCPPKDSTGGMYTAAFASQFCLDPKSTDSVAQGEADGYIGTFDGIKVYIPDSDLMLYSRKFYIPNVNVQDLT